MLVTSQGHGTGRAALRAGRYALICKVCVYFHFERFHPRVFFSLCLPVMSNIHAFLPAATFLQSCFLTQFVLLATLPDLVSFLKKKIFPVMQYLSLIFFFITFCIGFWLFSAQRHRQHMLATQNSHFPSVFTTRCSFL